MNEEIIKRAGEIVSKRAEKNDHNFVTLTLICPDGYPSSSTITISKNDGIRWLTFCTGKGGKADRLNFSNKACVCINEDNYHISLVGTVEELTDPETKKEMWYEGLSNHFTGYDDPNFAVLKFSTKRYNLLVDWNSAKGEL